MFFYTCFMSGSLSSYIHCYFIFKSGAKQAREMWFCIKKKVYVSKNDQRLGAAPSSSVYKTLKNLLCERVVKVHMHTIRGTGDDWHIA